MTFPTEIAVLLKRGWLSRLPADVQNALLDAAVWREIDEGQTFNQGGDDQGGIWGLARGQVDAISAESVPETPIADIILPGHWGGLAPLFGYPRAAHGTTRVSTLVAWLPQPRILALLADHPAWWAHFGALAMENARRYGGALADALIRDPKRRCIAVLLRLTDCRMNGDAPTTIIFTQDQPAGAANMSRYPTGEVLHGLAAEGLITLGYSRITVNNPAALRAIVDG
jgi:CRP/FNR family transcriptional regulator, cyclic AMP receptor protein